MGEHGIPATGGPALSAFLALLLRDGYEGEVAPGVAPLLTAATDNSIYQVIPAAVLHPRTGADLNRIVRAALATPGRPMPLSARGGGTGTNGQSLTRGAVVDVSRHMNRIVAFDAAAGTVTVEPGVVLDQLNDFLKPHGLFFPPSVSTASRATIGGMVATDASGKGSRIYGKTSDWVASLDLVLSDGSDLEVRRLSRPQLDHVASGTGIAGDAHAVTLQVVTEHAALIERTFPAMNRGLTGYNLKGVTRADGAFDLTYVLAGSEGTLALTKGITLRVARRPKHRALVVARYGSFDDALRDVQRLLAAEPSAIEVLDDKILALATQDPLWAGIEGVLGGAAARPVMGFNVIEFVGDDRKEIEAALGRAEKLLASSAHPPIDWEQVFDPATIEQLWSLRQRAVGLLGRMGGKRQGTAFVEDTAVPPEHLADFVTDFRAILDRHGLRYGMFGHADVGCLHVRPALDMADLHDAGLIRSISDEVAALTKSYGGLLWGEHGRGYRGEYSPLFFGPELYAGLCRIKRAFDPLNIFNPGKLATPGGQGGIDRIDAVPLRGEADRTIDAPHAEAFDRAIACNGNGACHSWDASEPMCPSYQATRDRVQSPKGRAMALREWARLASERDRGGPATGLRALAEEVKATLDTCLSCKACSSQCPVKVDVPTMKSRFLADYHRTRPRPLRDRVMAGMETVLPLARRFPGLANRLLASSWARARLRDSIGLVDLPELAPSRCSEGRGAAAEGAHGKVLLLRDSFLSTFDGRVHDAACGVLRHLGYEVASSPIWSNGKAEHVLGMRERFASKARRAQAMRRRIGSSGVPMVSLDAATGLLFEQEYQEFAPQASPPRVMPIEQFLSDAIEAGHIRGRAAEPGPGYRVHLHCTERTSRPEAADRWHSVMAHFGMPATVPRLGCCGMAGMFGHEVEHAGMSARIFDLSWRAGVEQADPDRVLATGFSCRCQTKRLAGFRPPHPVEAILARLERDAA